jgi:hypothetical protein
MAPIRPRPVGALEAVYARYRRCAPMTANVQRDRHLLADLDALLAETADRQLDALAAELAGGFELGGQAAHRLRALLRLALEFSTWQRLAGDGLADTEAAALMVTAARAAGGTPVSPARV